MTAQPGTSDDVGLLSPVRAGCAINALVSDDAWIRAMLDVEIALAASQARLGIIPADIPAKVSEAARTHVFDTAALAVSSRGAANPVVNFVEELTNAVADVDVDGSGYVHRGSTSQDILDTASMLIASRALLAILNELDDIAVSLAALARQHRTTPMAARTLAMHAVPTTFGAKAAGWLNAVLDARDRLRPLANGGLPVQLGGAAGTLSAYIECALAAGINAVVVSDPRKLLVLLSQEFAIEVGLSAPVSPWHTNRTPIADIASALAITTGTLGKIAADVIVLSRNEIREVSEPSAKGRGESSAMPQKRNPALSTLIRSASMQLPALVSVLHHSMVAEDERPAGAWHAEWQPLRDSLRLTGGAAETAADLVAGLGVDSAQMRLNLDLTGGQIVSERLSAILGPVLGKQATKSKLQAAAFEAERTGQSLSDVLANDPAIQEIVEDVGVLLAPEAYLGAAPVIVDLVLERFELGRDPRYPCS